MPYVPPLQMTLVGRFNFDMGSVPSFAQAGLSYRDSAWTSLDVAPPGADPSELRYRQKMGAYTVLNFSFGIELDNWVLTAYINNATDERGQTDIFDPGYASPSGVDYNQNVIRPRSFGLRFAQRF